MTSPPFAVARAHPNIALAKYWGKVPGSANAPAVPSLSVTLAGMTTETRVAWTDEPDDRIEINGELADPRARARAIELVDRVRRAAGLSRRVHVASRNDFPTASGLASSASGFAALALASAAAAGLPIDLGELSDWARRTSASSARSLFGGYVELDAGRAGDAPLAARPVAPAEALPLVVLVAVTTEAKKDVSSTDGMNRTARESPYYAAWLEHAPRLFAEVRAGVLAGDLARVGEAAEASALAMHASAIAAGVVYFRGATVEVLAAVRALRAAGTGAWATIDAGPHVKVLVSPRDAAAVEASLRAIPYVVRVLVATPGPGATLVEAT